MSFDVADAVFIAYARKARRCAAGNARKVLAAGAARSPRRYGTTTKRGAVPQSKRRASDQVNANEMGVGVCPQMLVKPPSAMRTSAIQVRFLRTRRDSESSPSKLAEPRRNRDSSTFSST